MNKQRTEAFDKFASQQSIDECERWIDDLVEILKTERGLKPSRREEVLEELAGWIRHYRIKTFNFRLGE